MGNQNKQKFMDNNQQKHQQFLQLIYQHKQWQQSIKPTLKKMAQKVLHASEITKSIKEFSFYSNIYRSFNPKRIFESDYSVLTSQYKKQLPNLFAKMASLILSYEAHPPKFPILYSGLTKEHTFNKEQILLLMSMMSMNLIPDQKFRYNHRFPATTTFSTIFQESKYKTTTIVEYLKQQFQKLQKLGQKYKHQRMTLKRYSQNERLSDIIQRQKGKVIQKPIMGHDKQSIEEYFGDIKIDFANKFIGGGALTHGCVQQQIMFANHPQMYTSVLFCEVMKENQAIQFIGYKKYFNNHGYGYSTGYDGPQKYEYKYDENMRAQERIVGIDALHYSKKNSQDQFSVKGINRQLYKAYVGFCCSEAKDKRIVTGNWGCGAFNGNKQLKFIIQLIASSLAGKQLVYIPFGFGRQLLNEPLYQKMCKTTASQIYKILINSQGQLKKTKDVFKLLQKKINPNEKL